MSPNPPPERASGPGPSEGLVDRFEAYHRDHPGRFWLLLAAVPALVLFLGVQVAPSLFWDQFIWKYLWGPIESDAVGRCQVHAGIRACPGYSFVSYLVYGPILLAAIFAIRDFLEQTEIPIDSRFVLGLAPMIVFGSMLRVMEDTRLFDTPIQYLAISPIIYFTLAFIAVVSLALGVVAERVRRSHGTPAGLTVVAVPALVVLGAFAGIVDGFWSLGFAFTPPVWVLFTAIVVGFAVVAVDTWGRDRVDPLVVAFGAGLAGLLVILYYSAWWIVGDPWSNVGVGQTFVTDVLPATLIGAVAITAAVTGAIWAADRYGGTEFPLHIFLTGFAVAMLFGHALDAWATTIALKDPLGFSLGAYSEKHPASNALIQVAGWQAWVAVKVGLVLGIVYLLDIEYEQDFEDRPVLVGLIKLAILVLGLGPGIRDVGRVTLGV